MKLVVCMFFSVTLSEFLACRRGQDKSGGVWGEESPDAMVLACHGAE